MNDHSVQNNQNPFWGVECGESSGKGWQPGRPRPCNVEGRARLLPSRVPLFVFSTNPRVPLLTCPAAPRPPEFRRVREISSNVQNSSTFVPPRFAKLLDSQAQTQRAGAKIADFKFISVHCQGAKFESNSSRVPRSGLSSSVSRSAYSNTFSRTHFLPHRAANFDNYSWPAWWKNGTEVAHAQAESGTRGK